MAIMTSDAAGPLGDLLRGYVARKANEQAARESCRQALPHDVLQLLYEFEKALREAGCGVRVLEAPDEEAKAFSVNPDSPSLTLVVTPRGASSSAITFACERQGLASWRGACWPQRETIPPEIKPHTKWAEQQVLRFLKQVLEQD